MLNIVNNFRNDHPEPVECISEGCIPTWLSGALYRIGSGLYNIGEDKYEYLIDGLSVVQKFCFNDGKITYQNRLLESETLRKNKAAQHIVVREVGTVPKLNMKKNVFARYMTYYFPLVDDPTDNCCVSIMPVGEQLVTMTETPYSLVIDHRSLKTVDRIDMSKLTDITQCTAHPHVDHDGTIFNVGSLYGIKTHYTFFRIRPTPGKTLTRSQVEVISTLKPRWPTAPSYYHSFAITENYIVFVEQTLTLNIPQLLLCGITGKSFLDCMQFYKNEKVQIHVIHKQTGDRIPIQYLTDSLLIFHHANAYEDENHIVLDVSAYDDDQSLRLLSLKLMGKQPGDSGYTPVRKAQIRRFIFPLSNIGKPYTNLVKINYSSATAFLRADGDIYCQPEKFPCYVDFPSIFYEKYNGRKYRYIYGVEADVSAYTLHKLDLKTKHVTSWSAPNCVINEAVFVPHPNETDEDDGLLLCPINPCDVARPSYLQVLSAADLSEVGRALVPSDINVPLSFHGCFIYDKSADNNSGESILRTFE